MSGIFSFFYCFFLTSCTQNYPPIRLRRTTGLLIGPKESIGRGVEEVQEDKIHDQYTRLMVRATVFWRNCVNQSEVTRIGGITRLGSLPSRWRSETWYNCSSVGFAFLCYDVCRERGWSGYRVIMLSGENTMRQPSTILKEYI